MGTSMQECAAYPCPDCGSPVNPMINYCRECGWSEPREEPKEEGSKDV